MKFIDKDILITTSNLYNRYIVKMPPRVLKRIGTAELQSNCPYSNGIVYSEEMN